MRFLIFLPLCAFCKVSEDKGKDLFDNSQAVCLSTMALAYLAVRQTRGHSYTAL